MTRSHVLSLAPCNSVICLRITLNLLSLSPHRVHLYSIFGSTTGSYSHGAKRGASFFTAWTSFLCSIKSSISIDIKSHMSHRHTSSIVLLDQGSLSSSTSPVGLIKSTTGVGVRDLSLLELFLLLLSFCLLLRDLEDDILSGLSVLDFFSDWLRCVTDDDFRFFSMGFALPFTFG